MNFFLITLATLCVVASTVTALQCYSCEGQNDDLCVTNPVAAEAVACRFNQRCYSWRKEVSDSSGFSVTMKRGCGQSVVATASSVGGNSISVSSYSCSTDLCNTGDAKQKLNVNTFNDFLGDLKVANNPAPYQGYYPTFNAGNAGNYQGNNPFFGSFPFYGNYPVYGNYAPPGVPDQSALLAPFYNYIASALNYQLQQLRSNVLYNENDVQNKLN